MTGLVPRLADFDLPGWRERAACVAGMRGDLERGLLAGPPDYVFVAEDASETRLGFVHLELVTDFFSHKRNAHVANIAVAVDAEGLGVGRQMMAFAESWAREHDCDLLTLAVFPGNARARSWYQRNGFGIDVLRMAKPLREADP